MSTTRKLREYKGWAYDPIDNRFKHLGGGGYFQYATNVVHYDNDLGDDDHAPLMDLKKNPYEPVVTLEDVVNSWFVRWVEGHSAIGPEIVDLCERIRTAFPHIDTPEVGP